METQPGSDAPAAWLRSDALAKLPPGAGPWGLLRPNEEGQPTLTRTSDHFEMAHFVEHSGENVHFGWGPDDEHLVSIYEIDAIGPAVVARGLAEERRRLQRATGPALLAIASAAGLALYWGRLDAEQQLFAILAMALFWAPLWQRGAETWWDARQQLARLTKSPDEWRRRQAVLFRFRALAGEGPSSRVALALIAMFVTLHLFTGQRGLAHGVERLGLLKPLDGEWWRLLTCGFMHGGLLHVGLNSLVGWQFAGLSRRLVGDSTILFVFLASVIAGAGASAMWTDLPSVGASGGVLGWGGLLLAISRHHPGMRGTGLGTGLLRWVVLIGVIGLLGQSFIDNAAHAGGLAMGYLIGRWIVRGEPKAPLPHPEPLKKRDWYPIAIAGAAFLVAMLYQLLRP